MAEVKSISELIKEALNADNDTPSTIKKSDNTIIIQQGDDETRIDLLHNNGDNDNEALSIDEVNAIIKKHTSKYQGVITSSDVKKRVKHDAKASVKHRFVVGDEYCLKNKPLVGRTIYKYFVCKKYIYSINDIPVNMVIMKPMRNTKVYGNSLTKHDCLMYHIKYEKNLYIYSMHLNWCPVKNKRK